MKSLITSQRVHGDIRRLESLHVQLRNQILVHGDIRRLEIVNSFQLIMFTVHGDIRRLENDI